MVFPQFFDVNRGIKHYKKKALRCCKNQNA